MARSASSFDEVRVTGRRAGRRAEKRSDVWYRYFVVTTVSCTAVRAHGGNYWPRRSHADVPPLYLTLPRTKVV